MQIPVCSPTKPDLMIRMLETLDIADGMRVLEIGTGTDYNAALLAHRLGDQDVCSMDIAPDLVAMRRRTTAGPTMGTPRPVPTTQPPSTRTTAVNPAELDGGFAFLAQLHLPAGVFCSIRLADDDQTPVT